MYHMHTYVSYNLPARIASVQVEPFNNNPDFTPEQIAKASNACTAICMWALAMYQYHFVALGVAPKVSGAVTSASCVFNGFTVFISIPRKFTNVLRYCRGVQQITLPLLQEGSAESSSFGRCTLFSRKE